ncbi:hypothetical protein F5146DRAFT_1007899 [Armillaria mellea]|nr:hypothetical protein F5146DRAFT_1007899 [Armillaria mellea]
MSFNPGVWSIIVEEASALPLNSAAFLKHRPEGISEMCCALIGAILKKENLIGSFAHTFVILRTTISSCCRLDYKSTGSDCTVYLARPNVSPRDPKLGKSTAHKLDRRGPSSAAGQSAPEVQLFTEEGDYFFNSWRRPSRSIPLDSRWHISVNESPEHNLKDPRLRSLLKMAGSPSIQMAFLLSIATSKEAAANRRAYCFLANFHQAGLFSAEVTTLIVQTL